jgi:hypothetical protein
MTTTRTTVVEDGPTESLVKSETERTLEFQILMRRPSLLLLARVDDADDDDAESGRTTKMARMTAIL